MPCHTAAAVEAGDGTERALGIVAAFGELPYWEGRHTHADLAHHQKILVAYYRRMLPGSAVLKCSRRYSGGAPKARRLRRCWGTARGPRWRGRWCLLAAALWTMASVPRSGLPHTNGMLLSPAVIPSLELKPTDPSLLGIAPPKP